MTFKVSAQTLDALGQHPTFLRATPDGFFDGDTYEPEIVAKPIGMEVVMKLFEDGVLVHTSEDCNSDPECPKCADPQARKYFRLRIAIGGYPYQIDLAPIVANRLAKIARNGIDGLLKMTCTPTERKGRTWSEIGFSIVKEAA